MPYSIRSFCLSFPSTNSLRTRAILARRIRRFSHGNVSIHSIASTHSVESAPMMETSSMMNLNEDDVELEESKVVEKKQFIEAESKAQGSVTFG